MSFQWVCYHFNSEYRTSDKKKKKKKKQINCRIKEKNKEQMVKI